MFILFRCDSRVCSSLLLELLIFCCTLPPKVKQRPESVGVPTMDEHSLLSPVCRRPAEFSPGKQWFCKRQLVTVLCTDRFGRFAVFAAVCATVSPWIWQLLSWWWHSVRPDIPDGRNLSCWMCGCWLLLITASGPADCGGVPEQCCSCSDVDGSRLDDIVSGQLSRREYESDWKKAISVHSHCDWMCDTSNQRIQLHWMICWWLMDRWEMAYKWIDAISWCCARWANISCT